MLRQQNPRSLTLMLNSWRGSRACRKQQAAKQLGLLEEARPAGEMQLAEGQAEQPSPELLETLAGISQACPLGPSLAQG